MLNCTQKPIKKCLNLDFFSLWQLREVTHPAHKIKENDSNYLALNLQNIIITV
jgi:hypothetical protein